MTSHTDGQAHCNASGDLQAIGRVDIQAGDLLWRFSIHPQQLDNQLCLVARRDPNHPVFNSEIDKQEKFRHLLCKIHTVLSEKETHKHDCFHHENGQ